MSETFDVVIVAGGSMAVYILARAGARVAVVEAGGHNIDRDIRHHQWLWEIAPPERLSGGSGARDFHGLGAGTWRAATKEAFRLGWQRHRKYYNDSSS